MKVIKFLIIISVILLSVNASRSVHGVENVNNQMRTGEIENSSGYLENSIQDKENIRLKEEDCVYPWIRVGSWQARFIRKETQKLPLLDTLIAMQERKKNMKKLVQYQTRREEYITNIKYLLSDYSNTIQQISTFSPEAVKKGFSRYLDFLMSRNNVEKIQVLVRMQKHVEEYRKNKQVNLKQWKKEIIFLRN